MFKTVKKEDLEDIKKEILELPQDIFFYEEFTIKTDDNIEMKNKLFKYNDKEYSLTSYEQNGNTFKILEEVINDELFLIDKYDYFKRFTIFENFDRVLLKNDILTEKDFDLEVDYSALFIGDTNIRSFLNGFEGEIYENIKDRKEHLTFFNKKELNSELEKVDKIHEKLELVSETMGLFVDILNEVKENIDLDTFNKRLRVFSIENGNDDNLVLNTTEGFKRLEVFKETIQEILNEKNYRDSDIADFSLDELKNIKDIDLECLEKSKDRVVFQFSYDDEVYKLEIEGAGNYKPNTITTKKLYLDDELVASSETKWAKNGSTTCSSFSVLEKVHLALDNALSSGRYFNFFDNALSDGIHFNFFEDFRKIQNVGAIEFISDTRAKIEELNNIKNGYACSSKEEIINFIEECKNYDWEKAKDKFQKDITFLREHLENHYFDEEDIENTVPEIETLRKQVDEIVSTITKRDIEIADENFNVDDEEPYYR